MITDANNGSLAISDDKGCSTIPQAMGAALRLFREQSGLSLSEVERRCNRTRASIILAERGDESQMSTFLALSQVYGIVFLWRNAFNYFGMRPLPSKPRASPPSRTQVLLHSPLRTDLNVTVVP